MRSIKFKWFSFRLRRFFGLFCIFFFVCLFGVASCADNLIFHPPRASYVDCEKILKIEVEDGQKISAIYEPNTTSQFTFLFSHGNAEDIGQNLGFINTCKRLGFGVLTYEYRGYGTSDGKATVRNTYQDIKAAYGYLTYQAGIDPNQIIVFGRSVGSGPSCWLAAQESVAGLILVSPFTSILQVVVPGVSPPFDKYNNLKRMKKIQCPVLLKMIEVLTQ